MEVGPAAPPGFAVDRVENGSEALQHALGETYDLLILDVMMPGLDGWEVLRRLRGAGLGMPVLNLGPWGKDFHKYTERVYLEDLFERTPTLVDQVIAKVLG